MAIRAATFAIMPARVIMLGSRTLAIDMLVRRTGVVVGVLMAMPYGGRIVMMAGVVICKLAGSRSAMMYGGFRSHDGLRSKLSNGHDNGQECREGTPPFPTICPQTQHVVVTSLQCRLRIEVSHNTDAHKKRHQHDVATSHRTLRVNTRPAAVAASGAVHRLDDGGRIRTSETVARPPATAGAFGLSATRPIDVRLTSMN